MTNTPSPLDQLLRDQSVVWRGWRADHGGHQGIGTGFDALDQALPAGGWPPGNVLTIDLPCLGIGELSLLTPAMATLSQRGRHIVFLSPPLQPYAPALFQSGIDPGRVLVIDTRQDDNTLWALEQLLRSRQCGIALAWPQRVTSHQGRRLQLAAQSGQSLAVLFNVGHLNHAGLQLSLRPATEGLRVDIVKARGLLHPASILLPL